jgi:hypothetical protein
MEKRGEAVAEVVAVAVERKTLRVSFYCFILNTVRSAICTSSFGVSQKTRHNGR